MKEASVPNIRILVTVANRIVINCYILMCGSCALRVINNVSTHVCLLLMVKYAVCACVTGNYDATFAASMRVLIAQAAISCIRHYWE